MRRIQVVMDPELDDRLEEEAAARSTSKSALIRELVERGLPAEPSDNGLLALGALAPLFADVEATDIDTELYGPLEAES
jgi:Ribbon-helix-helix protein, copG family